MVRVMSHRWRHSEILCRVPLDQSDRGAVMVGRLVVATLRAVELGTRYRALRMSSVTRSAVEEYLRKASGVRSIPMSHLQSISDESSAATIPIEIDESLFFGDVWGEGI